MTENMPNDQKIVAYFKERLDAFGATPRGVDWNSQAAQEVRFAQLAKVLPTDAPFSLLDYGCGYAALTDYLLLRGFDLKKYVGFDILPGMIEKASDLHPDLPEALFTSDFSSIPTVDYSIVSGTFNIKLEATHEAWTRYVTGELEKINHLSRKGFAFNLLTSYSDKPFMKDNLYYADPCYTFDYCKRHFSRNVALLHDYEVYDFTILVRKSTA